MEAPRSWRLLDLAAARPPRVACQKHGIRQIRIPWALPGCRLTIPFERHAIDVLLQADVLGSASLLRLSWDEAWSIMERAVARGQQAKKRRIIARLGVDEKAVATGHRYVTLVCDLDQSTVEYIANDRKKTSLEAWLWQLVLALVLICHSSYRGVIELLQDLFDYPISLGTVHNIVHSAVPQARKINQQYDLSNICIGTHDEIFQASEPCAGGGRYRVHLLLLAEFGRSSRR